MKRILSSMFLAALMLAVATGASAANISIVGGIVSPAPTGSATNDFLGALGLLGPGSTLGGYVAANLTATATAGGSVTLDFFGGEAGFNDRLLYNGVLPDGNAAFIHTGTPLIAIAGALGAPLASSIQPFSGTDVTIPFSFSINGLPGAPVNGANPNNTLPGSPANFFVACDPLQNSTAPTPATSCTTVWVFLDDNGSSDDNDFDDYALRITVNDGPPTVPEPASFALLGSGLIGLGLMARKVRK